MPRGRTPRNEWGGRKKRLHKHTWITYEFRRAVIESFESKGIQDTLSTFFPDVQGTTLATKRKSVYLWVKNKDKIFTACDSVAGASSRGIRQLGLGTSLSADAEKDLVIWVNEYRDEGARVSSTMLRLRALRVARESDVPRGYFEATSSWQSSFLHRHQLSFRAKTRQGQINPEDAAAVAASFRLEVLTKMVALEVDVVYNADQTPIFFEYIPTTTIQKKGSKTVWIRSSGRDKKRLSCMLLGNSHGEKKTLFLVLKTKPSRNPATVAINKSQRHGFGERLWKEVKQLQEEYGVQIYDTHSGWWTTPISVAFLRYQCGDRADMTKPVLFLWDDFSAHWTDEVTACAKELNIGLMRIPAGYTCVCQPADVCWNKPLKQRIRGAWVGDLQAQLDEANGRAFKLSPPDRRKVIGWVTDAWNIIASSTISNGFSCVAAESTLDPDLAVQYDSLAERLGALGLLDSLVGEVDTDVVDQHLLQYTV